MIATISATISPSDITGSADTRWDDDDLNQLKGIPGTAFEVVQLGAIHTYP